MHLDSIYIIYLLIIFLKSLGCFSTVPAFRVPDVPYFRVVPSIFFFPSLLSSSFNLWKRQSNFSAIVQNFIIKSSKLLMPTAKISQLYLYVILIMSSLFIFCHHSLVTLTPIGSHVSLRHNLTNITHYSLLITFMFHLFTYTFLLGSFSTVLAFRNYRRSCL